MNEPQLPESIKIRIINWKTYNPRSDVKRPSWFRLEADIMMKPENLERYGAHEIVTVVFLFSMAIVNRSDRFTVTRKMADLYSRVTWQQLLAAVENLRVLQVLHVDVTHPLRYGTGRDETGRGEESASAPPATLPGIPEAPKKPRKPKREKPLVSYEPLPEFESLRSELLGKVGQPVQEAWLKSYGITFVKPRIQKAYLWLVEKGFPKKDVAAFYGTWMRKDWSELTPQQQERFRAAHEAPKTQGFDIDEEVRMRRERSESFRKAQEEDATRTD